MAAYYNEIDPYCAQWLRNLISAGLIAPGDVDERSIRDVQAKDLNGYRQCHFFAGIGGWSQALRLAGLADETPVWTGSCPCQPFSIAGKRKGVADDRHLWPEFLRLISNCSPPVVFGEQVASKDGREWLAGVRVDLEAVGYAVGAADLCAASTGAPHIRQRLWWVAESHGGESGYGRVQRSGEYGQQPEDGFASGELADSIGSRVRDSRRGSDEATPGRTEEVRQERERIRTDVRDGYGSIGRMAYDFRTVLEERSGVSGDVRSECEAVERSSNAGGMGESERDLRNARGSSAEPRESNGAQATRAPVESGRPSNSSRLDYSPDTRRAGQRIGGSSDEARDQTRLQEPTGRGPSDFWSHCSLIPCLDNKARRIEPGTFPLAHGVSARMGKLRAYGNAIAPPIAAEFIRAYMDCRPVRESLRSPRRPVSYGYGLR